ncbi:hypothetical protein BS50DRAFT_194945 [Corynespora cassiicola Philippines]|uniref:Uncharacterized protein n=1 Tax=Corynespora cassiicola Philippines TaxID=1448308 RepID=A0A2T2P7Z1_CORCC|nr:hypothetical protein BS50DRAFT_194945 [Corynespora cassiicola Philippines]
MRLVSLPRRLASSSHRPTPNAYTNKPRPPPMHIALFPPGSLPQNAFRFRSCPPCTLDLLSTICTRASAHGHGIYCYFVSVGTTSTTGTTGTTGSATTTAAFCCYHYYYYSHTLTARVARLTRHCSRQRAATAIFFFPQSATKSFCRPAVPLTSQPPCCGVRYPLPCISHVPRALRVPRTTKAMGASMGKGGQLAVVSPCAGYNDASPHAQAIFLISPRADRCLCHGRVSKLTRPWRAC